MLNFAIILFLLIISELIYFRIADKFNIIDKPNLRSSHTHITLRGGGIIFLIGAWLYIIFYGITYPCFILGLTIITIISFIDDIHSIPNKYRLITQFISMFLMFINFDIVNLESWWIIIIALIICVGIINAYNFMDGINGITGGYSLAVLIPLIFINQKENFIDNNFLIVSILSVSVFCFFNFRKKAKCFAGDVGAVCIAFIILFALGKLILKTNDITYLMLLGLYGVDTVLTIIHRIMLHENLGEAHRKHAYQLMANELKTPHVIVSSIYMIAQLLVSFGLILIPINHWIYAISSACILGIIYIIFMNKYYHLHEKYLESLKK